MTYELVLEFPELDDGDEEVAVAMARGIAQQFAAKATVYRVERGRDTYRREIVETVEP